MQKKSQFGPEESLSSRVGRMFISHLHRDRFWKLVSVSVIPRWAFSWLYASVSHKKLFSPQTQVGLHGENVMQEDVCASAKEDVVN